MPSFKRPAAGLGSDGKALWVFRQMPSTCIRRVVGSAGRGRRNMGGNNPGSNYCVKRRGEGLGPNRVKVQGSFHLEVLLKNPLSNCGALPQTLPEEASLTR